MRKAALLLLFTAAALARTGFWAPANPPRATYVITGRIAADASRLDASETIRFRNTAQRALGRLAFTWSGEPFKLLVNGAAAERVAGVQSPVLFDMPRDIAPGESVELKIEYAIVRQPPQEGEGGATSDWYPRLWWGFGTLDDYEVKLDVPPGLVIAATGRGERGIYRASGVRAFAVFVGRGYKIAEADAGGVQVRTIYTEKGSRCAELLLKTAVDAIGFYRQRFGFYPHNALTIVPGMDFPAGGYPIATAMVAIHGQERFPERSEAWWRWITAHEIGHMYWSEHVLADGPDSLGWLMIGLGIYTDREYRRARGIKDAGELWPTYAGGVAQGFDTTMDVTTEQARRINFDFNNVVIHGKSSAALNALESVIGAKAFDALYRRCLREYAGKRLGWREFQRVAEQESGQELGWFFEQWVRSSAWANYKIAGQECAGSGGAFDCTVRVRREGTMRMPVTVAARFEDGAEQRATTDRLADEDVLRFRAASRLATAVVEPESAVVMAQAPPPGAAELAEQINALPWTGAGDDALKLYRKLREAGARGEDVPLKVAILLYDGRHYAEALEAFGELEQSKTSMMRFTALVWQGHLLDLAGRRADAIAKYKAALAIPGEPKMQHSQYQMTLDKKWVEERIETPFAR